MDTTSTYFELDVPDEIADLQARVDDDGVSRPLEQGKRAFGHSKDFRTDLPQVVIAMAVTRDGVPVRCWTFPGNTADTLIIRTVKNDLAGWNLSRMVWVADRGFASAANRAYLTRGGGHYIHAEKLRNTNSEAATALARPGRYRTVAGNLRVKEVAVAPGGEGDGDDGVPTQRFVVCLNPEQADRDAAVRTQLVAHLESLIDGSDAWTDRRRDELVGSLKTKPGLRRYLRRTAAGLLRVDAAAIKRESHLDGKWLLRTSDHVDARRPGGGLQAAAAGRTGLARHEGRPRAAAGVPPPRGPDPGARSAVLACPAAPTSGGTPPTTPGATSAMNSTGCTWSPSPPPAGTSPSALPPPLGRRPFWSRSSWPSHPGSSTSPCPATNPALTPDARRSNTTPSAPARVSAGQRTFRLGVCS